MNATAATPSVAIASAKRRVRLRPKAAFGRNAGTGSCGSAGRTTLSCTDPRDSVSIVLRGSGMELI